MTKEVEDGLIVAERVPEAQVGDVITVSSIPPPVKTKISVAVSIIPKFVSAAPDPV
jgi:hypothetical protein